MAIWLVRAGRSGEFENKFLSEKKIYLTWDDQNIDLSQFEDRQSLFEYLNEYYEDEKKNTLRNWVGQIYPFVHKMKTDDWVVLPSKFKSVIHIGRITGEYHYNKNASNPYFHYREVEWFAKDIPRTNFDQDLLY